MAMLSLALRTALLCVVCSFASRPVAAAIAYLGSGTIPGNATDDTGLTAPLEDGTPGNRAGGMGSAIAWSGVSNHYLMVPDRGPGDGTTTWIDRFYHVSVAVTPSGPGYTVTPTFSHAVLLRNESSVNFVGLSSAFDTTNSPASLRLDPEGLRIGPSGTTMFVSDEFGPFVYEFNLNTGTRLRSIDVAPKFLIANPNANNLAELPPGNTSGRQANRSMEGLAISPDGTRLYGLVQSPLLQDGALDASNNRVGTNCRLIEIELAGSTRREFLYQLSTGSIGATEVLAVNDHEFLVLERDGRGLNSGNTAQFKKIFKIDIAGATDITDVASLPTTGTPLDVTPVTKTLFLDVLVATGIAGSQFPEKLEGITFGPDLADGRHLLIVSADNDFKASIANWFFAFAVDPADLPGFVPQSIVPIVDATVTTSPGDLALGPPRPAPAHGMTCFDYALPRDGRVRLAIYDAVGRRVRRLLDGVASAGVGVVTWDCRDDAGGRLPPGAYFARLEANDMARIRKVIVVE
jgi:phytase-like protein/flagellar hook capping protein FlgD